MDQDTKAPFDISQYEMADTATLKVKNIFGNDFLLGNDGQPVTIEIYSPGSKEGVRALHKAGLAAQARVMRTMRGELDKDDALNADNEKATKLIGFTKAISPNCPITPSQIYGNSKLGYIAKQVEEFIGKDANFAKASSPS
jgi:hypothetical protein